MISFFWVSVGRLMSHDGLNAVSECISAMTGIKLLRKRWVIVFSHRHDRNVQMLHKRAALGHFSLQRADCRDPLLSAQLYIVCTVISACVNAWASHHLCYSWSTTLYFPGWFSSVGPSINILTQLDFSHLHAISHVGVVTGFGVNKRYSSLIFQISHNLPRDVFLSSSPSSWQRRQSSYSPSFASLKWSKSD